MTRAELFTAVLRDLNREDKVDFLPEWLMGTEFRINGLLRVQEMVQHYGLPVSEQIFPVPVDFLAPVSLELRDFTDNTLGGVLGPLLYLPADQLASGLGTPEAGVIANPQWFTIRGRYIQLAPWTGTGSYMTDLWYYAKLPKLVEATSTNWLLDDAPHIYRAIMLHFGFRNLQEVERSDAEMLSAMQEIQFLNAQAEIARTPTGPLIKRQEARLSWRHS